MTFFDAVTVMWRQRRMVIPVFALGMGGVFWVLSGVGAEYESIATIVFIPASVEYEEIEGVPFETTINPYFQANLTNTLARAVPIAVGSTTVRQEALEAGLSPNYEMQLSDFEPILQISAKASTPEISRDSLDFVLIKIDQEVVRRQGLDEGEVTLNERASYEILNEFRAIRDNSTSVKVFGTLSVAVMLLTVMAGFAAEGFGQRRDPKFVAVT